MKRMLMIAGCAAIAAMAAFAGTENGDDEVAMENAWKAVRARVCKNCVLTRQ